jgi:hypothetical protein
MLALALVIAAAAPAQPYFGISAGPVLLRESGRPGVGSGPMLRLEVGYPVAERFAAEAWLTGAMESAPSRAPGDRALVGAGLGGRFLLLRAGSEGNVGLWLHGGAGWGAPVAGDGAHGPTGFGGVLVTFQPFVKRFTLGLEADALAWRNTLGLAVLPTLRCAF